jgi:hypothetical protein
MERDVRESTRAWGYNSYPDPVMRRTSLNMLAADTRRDVSHPPRPLPVKRWQFRNMLSILVTFEVLNCACKKEWNVP